MAELKQFTVFGVYTDPAYQRFVDHIDATDGDNACDDSERRRGGPDMVIIAGAVEGVFFAADSKSGVRKFGEG